MDGSAADVPHAAEEIKANDEKEHTHRVSDDEIKGNSVLEEKSEAVPNSSEASSDDGHQPKKLDSHVVKVGGDKNDEEAYAHLPPYEREIIKRQLDIPTVSVNYLSIFRYATRNDILIIIASVFTAIAAGAVQPLMTVIYLVLRIR